jgi:AraC-like DNA-binding protein
VPRGEAEVSTTLACKVPVGLATALQECGVRPGDVLATARLPSHLLDSPGTFIAQDQYFALWHAVGAVSGDPAIGIRLVRVMKVELTEPLFLAMLSAADVFEAFAVVSRYKRLLEPQDLDIEVDEASQQVQLTFSWPSSDQPLPQVLVDAELAFIVEFSRRGTRHEDLSPTSVRLRAPQVDPRAGHDAFFGCPILAGSTSNSILFSAVDTKRPFLTHNPELLAAIVPYLQARTPPRSQSPIARIRSVIAERVRGRRPEARAVAKEVAMSTRAMQRLLMEHGTSFRQLLDEVRHEHARGYLRSTSYTDHEVSFLLGFEDPTSFYRAFRGWTGMSPHEFRRQGHSGV